MGLRFVDYSRLIWQVLVGLAAHRQTITYHQLAAEISDTFPARFLARPLDLIANYCAQEDLPSLTTLVVSTTTGQPSSKAARVKRLYRERERVYAHRWHRNSPPTVEQLTIIRNRPPIEIEEVKEYQ